MVPIDHFDATAASRPDAIAIVDGTLRLTFSQLTVMGRAIARVIALHADRDAPVPAAIYADNSWRFLAAKLGIMRAGGVVVPVHVKNTADMSLPFLKWTEPRCLFYDHSRADEVRRLKEELPSLRYCVCLDGRVDGDSSLDDLLAGDRGFEPAWIGVDGDPDRPVYYWATSGTTGEPRAVVETVRCFDAVLKTMIARRAASRNVLLTLNPMTHGGGPACFNTLALGGTVIVPKRFEPPHILATIETEKVTDMWLSPTALYLLLDWPEVSRYDVSSLRMVLLGTAAIAPDRLKRAVEVFGPCFAQSYGQIETGFNTILGPEIVAAAAGGTHPERLRSSGTSVHMNRFAVMSDDGRLLGPGQEGEIVVRGTGVKRYLDPAATAAARRGGWHHTGDLGYIDEHGFLYVVGRLKEVVNVSGFKVPMAEIERVIMELPEVKECAVVPVPDPLRGEAIKAIVVPSTASTVSTSAIVKHCVARLGPGKSPHSIEQWTDLPRSPAGKVDKHSILQQVSARPVMARR